MQIVKQDYEILNITGLGEIERAGRVCKKTEHRMGCRLPKDQKCDWVEGVLEEPKACCKDYSCPHNSAYELTKLLLKVGHEAIVEHGYMTVWLQTDRGVTHELVRHRPASYGQESTRFVSYSDGLQIIRPIWYGKRGTGLWWLAMKASEFFYRALIRKGWAPEEARSVLPHSIKTEIMVTANFREWRHIFKLRVLGTTGRPHPQIKALLAPVLEEAKLLAPAIFEDL